MTKTLNKVKTAMIMAAGLGERMKPLTLNRPKPLIKVAGKTLIDHIIERLLVYGIEKIVVNLHYLADQLEQHVTAQKYPIEIVFSDERDQLLETGGGLKRARKLVGNDPIFVINADAFWVDTNTPALQDLATHFIPESMDILLLMVPRAKAAGIAHDGDYYFQNKTLLKRPNAQHKADHIFGGVQIIKPPVIDIFEDTKFSLVKAFDEAEKNDHLAGLVHRGHWFHIGTPEAIPLTENRIAELQLQGKI